MYLKIIGKTELKRMVPKLFDNKNYINIAFIKAKEFYFHSITLDINFIEYIMYNPFI